MTYYPLILGFVTYINPSDFGPLQLLLFFLAKQNARLTGQFSNENIYIKADFLPLLSRPCNRREQLIAQLDGYRRRPGNWIPFIMTKEERRGAYN